MAQGGEDADDVLPVPVDGELGRLAGSDLLQPPVNITVLRPLLCLIPAEVFGKHNILKTSAKSYLIFYKFCFLRAWRS